MSLPISNALRDSDRTLPTTRRRRATVSPSSRHGRAVPQPGMAGTRAWTVVGHLRCSVHAPTAPPNKEIGAIWWWRGLIPPFIY
jgi:hypothetical protein